VLNKTNMSESWKWKTWGTVLLALFSIYLLVPSFFDVQGKLGATQITEPSGWLKFFPKKAINLGLDLRGGLYLELEVDLEKAHKNRLDLLDTQMEQHLKNDNFTFESVDTLYDKSLVEVEIDPAKKDDLIKSVENQFEGVFNKDVSTLPGIKKPENAVYQFKLSEKYIHYIEDNILKQAIESVRNRVDRYGVSEASVQRQGSDRIIVEVPGEKDPERVINLIRQTGQLEFRLVLDSPDRTTLHELIKTARTEKALGEGYSYDVAQKLTEALKGKIPENSEILFEIEKDPVTKQTVSGSAFLVEKKAQVTGEMLKNAQVNIYDNRPNVSLTFDAAGSRNFGELTKNNVNKQLAIILDGMISSAPRIDEPILSGQAEIRLGFGNYQNLVKEAEDLALILREGALPSSINIASKNIIGPSLGRDSIRQGLSALSIATLVVLVFMVLYYKWGGLLANVALILNVLLVFAAMSFFQASLSLPGLAGIVLTIGMAVDANIIIFERMREEKRLGKSAKAVVDSGYEHAMSAIVDSNLTTMISGIVLYQFGTGPIKGFATTLMIGILTTMFTAIVVTRLAYDYFVIKKKVKQVSI